MSSRRLAKFSLAAAIVVLVVSVAGFIITLILNAFFLDDYNAYGEVPIPGSASLHLPAGEVTITLDAASNNSLNGGGLKVPPLGVTIVPPDGVSQPVITENFGTTTTVNNDAHVRVWVAQIPAEGTYNITTDGQIRGYVNPRLAFGHSSSYGQLVWVFVALFVVGLVGSILSGVWVAGTRRKASAAVLERATHFPVSTPVIPSMMPMAAPESPTAAHDHAHEDARLERHKSIAALRNSGDLTDRQLVPPLDKASFGRYRLLSLIGEGGMGKVYKAHDTMMARDVAIKVLLPETAAEPGYEERFRREAHTAARLTEPHIIPIYEAGEIDGRLYLVMPIIDGIDVHSLLRRDGPLSPQRAVYVIEQLAAALNAAHAAGLVHRDIKPSNALVTGDDFVYLIDFGIAHVAAATRLTRTGSIVGTLAYMAPERFSAGAADARADVYSLACVLYQCLTGTTPFPGDSFEQQIAGHLTVDPPQPSKVRPGVGPGFDGVIAAGMAKNPDERYESARELAAAARRALAEIPTLASDPGTDSRPAPRARDPDLGPDRP
ncbi:MAG: hypothetical protein QOH91_3961 [Mycobacterium sp.]|nr:hypothetical protein [Mycobacterium sp.]